jgi:uncharacterized protein YbjT (DUF2867 family)
MPEGTVLVTGATGSVGRHVVEGLLAAGARVRALTRRPDESGLPAEVDVVRGDLAEPETVAAALSGVDRVYLFPMADALEGALAVIAAAGVRRVVLLSSLSVTLDELDWSGRFHQACERAVLGSGLPYTFLRPGPFMANDLAWASQVRTGVVRGAYADSASAPIDERDIAAVAVAALLRDEYTGVAFPLTGPELLSEAERVRLIGEALGEPVVFEELSPEEGRAELAKTMPQVAVDIIFGHLAGEHGPAVVTAAPEDVIGRPASRYLDWAKRVYPGVPGKVEV